MTWSYTYVFNATPSGLRNTVRLYAQENQSGTQRVQDEEIDVLIAEEANVYMAAARVAELVAGRMGPVASKTVGPFSISYGAKHYTDLAASLRARGATYQTPTVGGISLADRLALEADTDRIKPDFTKTMHDHPATLGELDAVDRTS